MALQKKPQLPKLNTPIGQARFINIMEPDTRFDDNGVYSVQLLVPEDDPKVKAIIKRLKDIYEEFRKTLDAKQAKKQSESYGFSPDVDDNGDETGYIVFKFKTSAKYKDKKGELKDKEPPAVFDAKLKKIPEGTPIWNGTSMIVNFSPSPYYTGKNCGVTLYLNACQIIELVSGSSRDASSYGFSEEEGYDAAPELAEDDEELTQSSSPEVNDEDF